MSTNEGLVNAVIAAAHDEDDTKYLSCAEAFELAKKFDVKPIEIGRICNEKEIRFHQCQLGCF